MRLSVVIVTYNEEKHIGDCLENVKFADDIIIVDSFSKDRTIEIAKNYTKNIIQVGRIGTGKIKNMGLDKAKNPWILNIDADERLTEELKKEIEDVLKDPKYDGYYISKKSFLGKKWIKHAGQWPDYQIRLFKKDRGRFQEKLVHERLIIRGKAGRLKNHMMHYNYDSWHDFANKRNWYTTREAQGLLEKKFVWVYPWSVIKDFFRKYRNFRRNKNPVKDSYVMARTSLDRYELKWTVPFKPLFAFLRFYIVQQGFRDGVHGLAWACGCAHDNFMKYTKYHDMKKGNKNAYEEITK